MKLYDQAEECELKVNDVVEIFGVFELDLEPEGVVPPGADNMQAMVAEERALRPPPSAQPRLHCILHRKLPAQHHPLLPPPSPPPRTTKRTCSGRARCSCPWARRCSSTRP